MKESQEPNSEANEATATEGKEEHKINLNDPVNEIVVGVKGTDEPFQSPFAAKASMRNRNLPAHRCRITGNDIDGYLIRLGPVPPKTTYHVVQFLHKRSEVDSTDVYLAHNGLELKFMRGVPTIVPSTHLELADNTKKIHWVRNQEEGLKAKGVIHKYPYIYIREATKQEFLDLLNKKVSAVQGLQGHYAPGTFRPDPMTQHEGGQ